MRGQDFVTVLKKIGFPQADNLDPDSFDWMFDCQESSFLSWFCHEVDLENVINTEELSKFEKLSSSGGVILEGLQLEKALANQITLKESSEGEDDIYLIGLDPTRKKEVLKKTIEESEGRLKHTKKRKNILVKQRDLLANKSQHLSDRCTKLEKVATSFAFDSQKANEKLKSGDEHFFSTVKNLLPVRRSLLAMYEEFDATNKSSSAGRMVMPKSSLFTSCVSLDQFHKLEAEFTRELGFYAKKLFPVDGELENNNLLSETLTYMDNSTEEQKSEFDRTSYVSFISNSLSFQLERNKMLISHQREVLAFLQETQPLAEIRFIEAHLEECKSQAMKEFLDKMVVVLNDQSSVCSSFPDSITGLEELTERYDKELSVLSDCISEITQCEIPELVRKRAQMDVALILMKDYDREINVREKLLSNQDQVIEKLIVQRSRGELVSFLLEEELASHKHLNAVFNILYNFLHKSTTKSKSRCDSLSEKLTKTTSQSTSLPILSKEKFLHRLHSVLQPLPSFSGDQHDKQLCLSLKDLEQATSDLVGRSVDATFNEKLSKKSTDENILSLSKQIQDCLLLFPRSSLKLTRVVTSPDDELSPCLEMLPSSIINLTTELDNLLKPLEKAIKEILEDVEKKRSVLKSDRLLSIERQLHKYFFNDPKALRTEMDRIKSRISTRN